MAHGPQGLTIVGGSGFPRGVLSQNNANLVLDA